MQLTGRQLVTSVTNPGSTMPVLLRSPRLSLNVSV